MPSIRTSSKSDTKKRGEGEEKTKKNTACHLWCSICRLWNQNGVRTCVTGHVFLQKTNKRCLPRDRSSCRAPARDTLHPSVRPSPPPPPLTPWTSVGLLLQLTGRWGGAVGWEGFSIRLITVTSHPWPARRGRCKANWKMKCQHFSYSLCHCECQSRSFNPWSFWWKVTRYHYTHKHRLWHLEIFMDHFNNAAGKRLPWAVTQGSSFIVGPLFQTGKNIIAIVIIPNTLITPRDGENTDWWPLARHSRSPKTMQLFHAVAYICPSITSDTVAVHSSLLTPQLYEGHFKFRPHVRTVLVQLGRGILSRIIILWYMEVFIWLQGSNVTYQA